MKRGVQRARGWLVVCGAAVILNFAIVVIGQAGAHEPSVLAEVLTLEEAATLLRVTPQELESLALRRGIPSRRIGTHWRFSRTALLAWLAGASYGTAPASGDAGNSPEPGDPLTHNDMSRTTAAGTTTAAATSEPSSEVESKPIGEAPKERTAEQVFLRRHRVLLAPGEVNLNLSLFYSESDDQQLALVNGGLGLATVERNTFTTLLTGRYGLFEETELFTSTSYRNQDSSVFLGSRELSDSSRSEFGNVRLGLRRTVLHENVGRPNVILTFGGDIPTGDTSYALGGGIALVKSFDPVALFANVNYRHAFSRDFDDVTRLEPENRINATLGYAYALNDRLTLSTSLSGLFLFETEFDNATLRQQELFSLQFGLTSLLTKTLYIEPSVSFNLNGPGNSFAVGVTLPYTFKP